MLDGIVSLVSAVVEFIVSLVVGLIDFVAGFFVAAGETLTALDLFLVLFVVLAELMIWSLLWIKEFSLSLFGWRKPRHISKPTFWRPTPKIKKLKSQ